MGSQGILYQVGKIRLHIIFETNGVETRAMKWFPVQSNRLLSEQTNEIAHEDEATFCTAQVVIAIGVAKHLKKFA